MANLFEQLRALRGLPKALSDQKKNRAKLAAMMAARERMTPYFSASQFMVKQGWVKPGTKPTLTKKGLFEAQNFPVKEPWRLRNKFSQFYKR